MFFHRIAIVALVCIGQALSQTNVDTLTIDKCISMALKHSPLLLTAQGSQEIAQGGFYTARAPLLPQLNLQSSYNRAENVSGAVAVTQASGNNFSAGIYAQQLLLDFGKNVWKTAYAFRQWKAAGADLNAASQNLALSAEVAYVALYAAKANLRVSIEAQKQAEAYLTDARTLLTAGRGVRFNVVKAEVDVANSQLGVLRSMDALRSAHLQLETTIGARLSDSLVLADSLAITADTLALDSAIVVALRSRPELIAARLRRDAAGANLSASRMGMLPQIFGSAGYTFQAPEPNGAWSQAWNAGLNLTFPLFAGGALAGATLQAKGARETAQALLDELEQAVTMEVELQLYAWHEALTRMETARKAAELAALALTLAQDRYRLGSGSALEMTDSELSLTNAKLNHIQAMADCRAASAKLRRAVGKTVVK